MQTSSDIATCMWYTGVDPMSGRPVKVARHLRDRKHRRALMQFFKPDNWFEVRDALVGTGCDALIPPNPPTDAVEARRKRANDPDHYHTVANPAKGERPGERGPPSQGYRPGRKSARRQDKKRKRKTGGSDPRP